MTGGAIAQHLGGIPELAMAIGPVLLIAVFVRIARRAEAQDGDAHDDWDDGGERGGVRDADQPMPSSSDRASASSYQSVSRSNT